MNNLKFRAWSVNNKQMYYATPYRGYIKSNGSWWGLYNGDDVEVASSVNDTLMQYTGLKDINGVEIYEGDIVQTIGNKFEMEINYSCLWHVEHYNKLIEVIGNIHENGDLLK